MLSLQACTKFAEYTDNYDFQENITSSEETVYPGKKLEDPFAISNITRAYDSLKQRMPDMPELDIKPNHVYLRFLPANEKELEILRKDTTLILYDYPLDYEITGEGEITKSLSGISADSWQYCVVPSGRKLPDVFHEILYEVFIPVNDEYCLKSTGSNPDFYDLLIDESARITGNTGDNDTLTRQLRGISSPKWNPKGRIRAWDDLLNDYIPLEHVSVHARWFTHIETALTNENGYFQTKSFRNKVNYSIKWENSQFTIRNGLFSQAWYNGPKIKGDWNLDIRDGKSLMFATIHRAAFKYFYGDALGLDRPGLKYGGRTKICYKDEPGTGIFLGDWGASGIVPDIIIWGGDCRTTTRVFGSTVHELGHQAHSQCVGNIRFFQSSKIIRESWADAVEWALTNDEYNKLGLKFGNIIAARYDHESSKHDAWPFVKDKDYSPIFIDLIDKINQRDSYGPGYPNDRISQYSISFINRNLLTKTIDIGTLRNEVYQNKLEGVTDNDIDELFMLY